MVRSRTATQPKRTRRPLSEILTPVEAEPSRSDSPPEAPPTDAAAAAQRPLNKGPGVKLWGFVRRHEDVREPIDNSELMPQDIAIWYDRTQSRFQIVADHKVIDDLAPVEFVQFVRALRFSATQILFKLESRADGTAGRPVCVWAAPIRPVIAFEMSSARRSALHRKAR